MEVCSLSRRASGRDARRTKLLLPLLPLLVLGPGAAGTARADTDEESKTIFRQRCTACHTFGRGTKVGPDLKGVTERRPRAWLLKFVRQSQKVIQSGDPVAVELFRQFKRERMPDWTEFSEAQINALLDWLAASGPEQKEPDERAADLAGPTDVDWGRRLFHGASDIASGAIACASCHSVREGDGRSRGGTLASELTNIYTEYQDRALTLKLKHPCSVREPERSSHRYLTPQESFAIKAYLRSAAFPRGVQGRQRAP